MKRKAIAICILLVMLMLPSGCKSNSEFSKPAVDPQNRAELAIHEHVPYVGNNVREHEPAAYCGNTVTEVSFIQNGGTVWEKSFMGGYSVRLTDLASYLDYSEAVCECEAEYVIVCEGFGQCEISLEHGFARSGGKQVQLTDGQLTELKDIIAEIEKDGFDGF